MDTIEGIVFLGSKKLGLDTLKTIWKLRPDSVKGVVTFDDSDDTRSVLPQIIEFCAQVGLEVKIVENRKDAEDSIQLMNPDLCLVVCWYWLLSNSLINSIQYGVIGIHNSLLPRYRGGSPLVWAIINGEQEAGFSIFSLVSDMDAGDIWLQEKVEIFPTDTIATMMDKIEDRILRSLNDKWCALLNGKIAPTKQLDVDATYCAQRVPADGRIDWKQSAKEVYDFIRAQTLPYPGAFSVYGDKRIYIFSAELYDFKYFGSPGQIAKTHSIDGVYVICGDSRAIILKMVTFNGEIVPASQLLSSITIRLTS
jgi:methionyl-tRNA formyltransferase